MTVPRILLVDDDPGTIHALRHMLAGQGEIQFARSGDEALRCARAQRPDLILLDAEMPGLNGYEACKALKADPELQAVPVIFVTAHGSTAGEVTALELGAADFVRKPLDAVQVLARVHRHLRATIAGADPDASDAPGDERAAASVPAESAPRVLIVDDDRTAIQAMHAALSALGIECQFATNGGDALRLAARHRPDVVLLDVAMPGVDGFEVCRMLQDHPQLRQVPVVFVSRYSSSVDEARGLAAGGVDYIAKPFQPSVLQARVRRLLGSRRATEAALRAERERGRRLAERRMEQVFEEAFDAIVSLDAKGRVVLINAAALALFGLERSATLGRRLDQLLRVPAGLASLDGPRRRQQLELCRADGTCFPAELSVSPSGESADRLTTLIVRDLSDRHRAEQAQLQRVKAEADLEARAMLQAFVAHEIGNPLNVVLGFADVMALDARHPLPPVQSERLAHVRASGRLMATLLKDLLDLSRSEIGALALAPQTVALDALLAACGAAAGPFAAQARVRLHPPAPARQGLRVRADPTRLRQCIDNLVHNAIKYTPADGEVTLHAHHADGRVRIDVRDSGIGLSEDQRQHLFEPFNRLGRGGAESGNGIGLLLTRRLVDAMGGRLLVDSEAGKGSCFTIELPAAEDAAPDGHEVR